VDVFYIIKDIKDTNGHIIKTYGMYSDFTYWINYRGVKYKNYENNHQSTSICNLNSRQRRILNKLKQKMQEFLNTKINCSGCIHENNLMLTGKCNGNKKTM
jgi:hypothetical protein